MALIPKDLQKFTIDGPSVAPQYIKPTRSVLAIVEQIHDCFRYALDDTYGNLIESLEPLCLSSQRHRLMRGIIHVLESRLAFNDKLAVDPLVLREALFKKSALVPGDAFENMEWREKIANEVSSEFNVPPEELDDLFYADLKSERKIVSFEELDDEEIVAEYNLAMAKSLLMYARSLSFTIELAGDYAAQSLRELFRSLHFFNLLFDIRPITEAAWQFTVDGPSAVLPQPQKYAVNLASFLPTLYRFAHWQATADLDLDGKKLRWQLKPDDFTPPTMHFAYRLPVEVQQLALRIAEIDPHWTVSFDTPLLDFGAQAVWVPDFTMHHEALGKTAYVEMLGFWRADYLNRRLKMLKKAPKNLILVLSSKMKIDAHALAETNVKTVVFKRTPRPQDVIAEAMKC